VTHALRRRSAPIITAMLLAASALLGFTPQTALAVAPDPTLTRICSSTANAVNFDVEKPDGPDSDTALDYNNELKPGECTGWQKNVTGAPMIRMDLTDDGANEGLDSYKQGEIGFGFEACDKLNGVFDPYGKIVEPIANPLQSPDGINVRLYFTADPDEDKNVYCGVTIPSIGTGESTTPTCAKDPLTATANQYDCDYPADTEVYS
jgi:hypothetical protein